MHVIPTGVREFDNQAAGCSQTESVRQPSTEIIDIIVHVFPGKPRAYTTIQSPALQNQQTAAGLRRNDEHDAWPSYPQAAVLGTAGGGLVAVSPMGRSDEEPAATLEALAAVLPSASCHVAGLNPASFRCVSTAACVWCPSLLSHQCCPRSLRIHAQAVCTWV